MVIKDWQGIWIIAEQSGGCLHPISLELLGKAKQLKTQLNTPEDITVVLLGNDVRHLTMELEAYGPDHVIAIEDPALEIYENQTFSQVLTDLIKVCKPSMVLMSASAIGQDLAAILGITLNTGVAAHGVQLSINHQGNLVTVVPAFGGKVLGDILCPNHRPQIATVKPGVFDKPAKTLNHSSKILSHDPLNSLKKVSHRVRALGIHKEEFTGVPLEEAEVVVAGGWGVGSKENWLILEELAKMLGGAVGCTRPPIDEGWAEGEHQMIGTSGKTVRPKVYLGVGISGATHHICGMKDADLVISINNDAQSPIFEVSDISIVGEAKVILTKLVEEIKNLG